MHPLVYVHESEGTYIMISQQGAFCLYYYTEDASFTTVGATHDERTTDETSSQTAERMESCIAGSVEILKLSNTACKNDHLVSLSKAWRRF